MRSSPYQPGARRVTLSRWGDQREFISKADARARRPRRVQRHRAAHEVPRRVLPRLHRLATTCRPRSARSPASTRTRRPAASRTRARSASPRPSTWSSGWSTARRRAGDRPGRAADEEPAAARAVPVHVATGWEYDSGDYPRALQLAMDIAGYDELRREQAEKRARGELMGIGLSFFTEAVGAGPRKHMDILGLGMADGCELRVHPTGKARAAALGADPGPGPRDDVRADRRARSSASRPRTSRSSTATPTTRRSGWAPTARVRRRCPARRPPLWRNRSRQGPDHRRGLAGGGPDDLEWEHGRWFVSGDPEQGTTIPEIAMAAHGDLELPDGVEGHLDASRVYDPPNLTYPFGAYICVVDVDAGTGQVQGAPVHRGRRLRRRGSTR